MKVVYVISPDFLESIFQESKKYSFELQGYGNFLAASRGIIYTNIMDILGFVYMTENFPATGSKEFEDFLAFAELCDLANADKKFVIITKAFPKGIDKKLKKFSSLRFAVYVETDLVTDVTINQNLFGSILLDNYEPYKLKEDESSGYQDYGCTVLEYCEVVPQNFFDVFAPIHIMETEKDSISLDIVIMKYNEDLGNPLVLLRIIAILIKMERNYEPYRDKFLETLKLFKDKRYGIYLAGLRLIEGRQYEG